MASSLRVIRLATRSPSVSCWNSSELSRLRQTDLHVRSQSTSTKLSEESDRETVKKPPPASFVMGMFSGQTVLRQVFPFPDVLDDDQLETINMMRESNLKFFTEFNDALENDEKGEVKAESYRMLAEMGSFGAIVPVQYEGAGMNATQSLCLSEIAGQYDLGLSVTLGVHGIGYRAIIMCGTEEQKQKYLPDLATGKKFAAFALTEPGSGSDAGSIKTRAELSPDGKHYILNGSKIWISNGGLAEVFTIFAKTPVTMPNGEVKDKITAFIVERDFGGISSSPPMNKMGLRCSNTVALYLDNVKVPVENVLGEIGGGFKVAMNVLNGGRYGMAGLLTGTMRTLIEKASQFANDRIQFGSKISSFENVQEKLARMAMLHYTTESIGFIVAGNIDSGSKECHLEAAIGKIYSSEAAWNVCDETMQIMGGMGYMRESGVEKIMRDLRIFRVFEGANDILRLFIALTGLQNAGLHLKELQKAFKNPVANLELIFGESTRRAFRAVGLGSGPSISEHVAPELRDSATLVTKSIENFGATVEHLLIKYNKNIISEQFLLTRLANSAIDIYSMIVTISRATRSMEKNYSSAEHEIKMVKVICSEAFERSQRNLQSIRANENLKNYSLMKDIAKNIISKNGVYHVHPIRLS